MYAKFSELEILSTYIRQVSVGDLLTVHALITNPLDWHHFYEKILRIEQGELTDFTVVTKEGDRLVGTGNIEDIATWSNGNKEYGFKIKINIKKQKSLTDRRSRRSSRIEPQLSKEKIYTPTSTVIDQDIPTMAVAKT
jgi:hypothetical protein